MPLDSSSLTDYEKLCDLIQSKLDKDAEQAKAKA